MRLLILLTFIITFWSELFSQGTDLEYESIPIGDVRNLVSGLAISPDNKTLAISSVQGLPFFLFDIESREITKEFNVGNWYGGSSIEYSSKGKYVLMNQLFYADFAVNKDREVKFDIINSETGERIKRFKEYHAVTITKDEKYALALSGEAVIFWNISTNTMETAFNVDNATNAIAVSPDGNLIAVSHKLSETEAKKIPQLQRDKKVMKSALKYKQQVSVYDINSFKKVYTVNELYDIIYKLKFSEDGKNLFCQSIPHVKQQNTASRQTYLNVIDAESGAPKRRGFTSQAFYEPDFKLSHDGKLLGLVSRSNRFIEIHVYNFETGDMEYRFQQSFRLIEKNDAGLIAADSRSSFIFLPDNKSIIMTMGNHLILWEMTKTE